MSGWARPSIFFSAPHCCILTETTGVLSALALASDAECTLSSYVVTTAVIAPLLHAVGGGGDAGDAPAARRRPADDGLPSAPCGRVTEAASVDPFIGAPLSGTPSMLVGESLRTLIATEAALIDCGASPSSSVLPRTLAMPSVALSNELCRAAATAWALEAAVLVLVAVRRRAEEAPLEVCES